MEENNEELSYNKSEDGITKEELKDEIEETGAEENTQNIEESKEFEEKEIVIEEKKETEKIVEEKGEIQEEKSKARNKKNKIVIIVILVIVLLFISTIFAIININNDKIISGITIAGVDVSGLSEDEAANKFEQKLEEVNKKDIILQYNDYTTTITPEQIEMTIDYKNSIQQAKKIGKTNNILVDNYNILKANIFKTNIDVEINYNQEVLYKMIKNIDLELPGAIEPLTYEVEGDKLIITNSKAGVSILEEELENKIIENIKNELKDKTENIEIPVENVDAEKIDIERIHSEIYKEAKDAYIEENPFKLHVEENGLDFKITIEEAKEIVSEYKEEYEIPLKITKPKVRTEDLGSKIFKETLSKYTTIYDAGNKSRATNIAIAAKTINGTILLPGETFSYNKVLGNTTKEKGYQLGGAYVGGKVVQAYGGGICQVSTTLYNAVLYANLEIVERYNHSYAVSYVPAGRDATVSYGGKDFKFKNSRTYPVKIVASAKNGVVSVSLVGIKEEKEYEVEIKSSVLSTTPYSTTYQNNSSLAEGKQRVIQNGHNGYKSKAYKIIKYNGKVISKILLSSDTYQPMNRIIEKGTKKVKEESKKDTTKEESKKEENKKEENKIEEAEITENED